MFLTYLSDLQEEEKYWPFVFRLETVLAGIVREGFRTLAREGDDSKDNAYLFLFNALGACLDSQNNLFPPGWWPEPIPSIEWFDAYLHRELDAIIAESRRLAALPLGSHPASIDKSKDGPQNESKVSESLTAETPIDKAKVRELAHLSPAFRQFILPFADADEDHSGPKSGDCGDDCRCHDHGNH